MEAKMKKMPGSEGQGTRFWKKPACLSTGFEELDYAIGGLRAGSITCFGCRYPELYGYPLLHEMVLRAAERGVHVLYFNYLVEEKWIRRRFLAHRLRVDPETLPPLTPEFTVDVAEGGLNGDLSDAERACCDYLSELPILINNGNGWTWEYCVLEGSGVEGSDVLEKIRVSAESFRKSLGPDDEMLIAIDDYEHMFRPTEGYLKNKVDLDEWDLWEQKSQSAKLSFGLRSVSLDCDAPVLALASPARRVRFHKLAIAEDFYTPGTSVPGLLLDQDCDVFMSLDEVVASQSEFSVGMKMRAIKNSYGGHLPLTVELPALYLEPELTNGWKKPSRQQPI